MCQNVQERGFGTALVAFVATQNLVSIVLAGANASRHALTRSSALTRLHQRPPN
jgi:hypothetical protein